MGEHEQTVARESLTAAEAMAIVQLAVAACEEDPDWLLGLRTAAGPIVVACHGRPDSRLEYDMITDNVSDAVNWLVAVDQEDPDRAGVTALAQGLLGLVEAVRAWEALMRISGEEESFDTGDAIEAGNALVSAARVILAPYDIDDEVAEQEELPFPDEPRCRECEKPTSEHNYDCTQHPEPR